MNYKYIKWFNGALISTAIISGLVACSDDHFDINPEVSGRGTLWENIESNENLTEFADILKRVKYSSSEGTTTSETYAEMFGTDQTFTVWAPKNDTFNYTYYDSLINTGSATNTYKVEKELIRNCMTRYSHVLTGADSVDLELFNSKTATFNCADGTIKDQKIVESNIAATNGILHVIDGAIEYQKNLYEYINEESGLDSISNFLKSFEKYEFDENSSTQGPTIDGQITWVDSITYLSNDYFYYMNAYINREDSSYAMILPTNEVWANALEQTKKYYVYNESYKMPSEESTSTITSYTTYDISQEERDSLLNLYSKHAILCNSVFNANYQYGKGINDFAVVGACDSLTTTYGETFYSPLCAELFAGATPIELSNGWAYKVNEFNYPATLSWATDWERKLTTNYADRYRRCTVSNSKISTSYTYTDTITGETLADTTISMSLTKLVPSSPSVNPEATFRLPQVLSCKYDIYLLVPYNYEAAKPTRFRVAIGAHELGSSTFNETTLDVPDSIYGEGKNFVNRAPRYENGKFEYVDSILIAKDYEFPVSYAGLENGDVYPTIKVTVYVSDTRTYSRELWLDQVVLKTKEQ